MSEAAIVITPAHLPGAQKPPPPTLSIQLCNNHGSFKVSALFGSSKTFHSVSSLKFSMHYFSPLGF